MAIGWVARAADRRADRYRWYALGVTTFSQGGTVILSAAIGPLAPFLVADFDISLAQIGLFSTAIYLAGTFSSLVGGRAADRFGERWVLIVSGLGAGLAGLLVILMGSYTGLLVGFFLLGLFNGIQNPAGSAAIMRWFARQSRGAAMGIRQTGVPIGGMIAASVFPAVALAAGWRPAYAIAVTVALTAATLIFLSYRDPRREDPAVSEPAVSLAAMVRDRRYWWLAMTYNGQIVCQFATNAYFVLFLTQTLDVPVGVAGGFLALVNLVAIGARIGWGIISDRVFRGARRPVLSIIIGLTVASALLAAALPSRAPAGLAGLLAIALGVSAFSWTGIYGTLVIETAGRTSAATAVALVHVFGGFGSFLGPPAFGWVVDRTGSFSIAWLLVAAAALLGLVATFQVTERRSVVRAGVDPPAPVPSAHLVGHSTREESR